MNTDTGNNPAHGRFAQAFDWLRFKGLFKSQTELAKILAVPQPHISAALKGDPRRLTDGFLRKVADAFAAHISPAWLLDGTGRMEPDDAAPATRPHFDARAAAGFLDGYAQGTVEAERCPLVPFAPDYDFTIEAAGRSMEPDIMSGDTLLCRRIHDRLNPPLGRICVFDTAEGALVKVLLKVTPEAVLLHSINPDYPDPVLSPLSVLSVALVVGITRTLD